MNTNKKLGKNILLSVLWVFVMINLLKADILWASADLLECLEVEQC